MGSPEEIFKEVCAVLDSTNSLDMSAKEALSDANIVFVLGMFEIYNLLSCSCRLVFYILVKDCGQHRTTKANNPQFLFVISLLKMIVSSQETSNQMAILV